MAPDALLVGHMERFFTAATSAKTRVLYYFFCGIIVTYAGLVLVGPSFAPDCDLPRDRHGFQNVDYQANYDPCRYRRLRVLGGLNNFEAEMFRRVLFSMFCGSVVGVERASTKAVSMAFMTRLMTIIALCGCTFTIASMFSYLDGPVQYDASRATAQIPKGVGVMCGAVLWTSSHDGIKELRGATTAAAVFSATAIGTIAGGGLYVPALFATAMQVASGYVGQKLKGPPAALQLRGSTRFVDAEGLMPLAEPLLAGGRARYGSS